MTDESNIIPDRLTERGYEPIRPVVPEMFGYTAIALMDDGESLCFQCVEDESNPVHTDGDDDGWKVVAWFASGDVDAGEREVCAHCGRVIVDNE